MSSMLEGYQRLRGAARTRPYWYPPAVGSRGTVVGGLLAGMAVAVVILVGAVFLLPEPSPGVSAASASPSAPASQPATTGPSPTGASAGPSVQASIGTTTFHVGEHAPALVVAQVGGGTIDLTRLAGKPVWINFMQTTCPPCIDEFPVMNGFYARYAATGLVVMAIDVREDEGTIGTFAQSLNTKFPIGMDSDGKAALAWDAVALPVHFWIDAQGIIRAGALGGIGPDVMAKTLQTILPGVTVPP